MGGFLDMVVNPNSLQLKGPTSIPKYSHLMRRRVRVHERERETSFENLLNK